MGMFAGRRFALIGTVAAVVWYVCIVVWATQSATDSVPVGIDQTLAIPKLVSVSVKCNGLFDGTARDNSPLPALKAQPKDKPALKFQREPCDVVHNQARLLFALDTALFAGVFVCFVWFFIRKRRTLPPDQLRTDPGSARSLCSTGSRRTLRATSRRAMR
jgi:hypothetical protein